MEARLPEDKLARIRQLLDSFTDRHSACLLDLQSLISTLQFACRVVVPGRTLLQRIIIVTQGVKNRFHHIRLTKEFYRDIQMWKVFLAQWKGRSFFLDSGHSKAPRVMDLVRFLVLISMKHNFLFRARHVPGVHNEVALSCFQV